MPKPSTETLTLSGGRKARPVETIVAGEIALQVTQSDWHEGLRLPASLIDAGDKLATDRHTSGVAGRVTSAYDGGGSRSSDGWPSERQSIAFKRYNAALNAIPNTHDKQAVICAVIDGGRTSRRLLIAGLASLARHYGTR